MANEPTAREMIAYCDEKNREAGLIQLMWLRIKPEDNPDDYIGLRSDTREIVGPGIKVGIRVRIIYREPVRLPFFVEGEGNVAMHVAEITGLVASPCVMTEVEGVCCQPDDHTVRLPLRSTKSILRVFIGDTVETV